jgi:hypothetical protein
MAWSMASPNYPTGNCQTEFDQLKENMAWTERAFFMLAFLFTAGHYVTFTYNGTYTDRVDSLTVKNTGGTTIATCTYTYNGTNVYQLDREVWVIFQNAYGTQKTLQYDYVYSSGKIQTATLTSIT